MPTRHGGRVVKIASVVLALICVPMSHAQDGDALDEIRAEMARLREENARIRGELDRMNRARDPELDRLMRAQIGMAVDAAMAQVQSEQQMTAGWNDGFFLASEDGNFSMELGALVQFRFIHAQRPNPVNGTQDQELNNWENRWGFEFARTDLLVRGHLYRPELQYFLNLGITREEPGLVNGLGFVKDLWLAYDFQNDWRVRVGQFKIHHSREESTPSSAQMAVERTLLNEALNLGRTQGIELTWSRPRDVLTFTTGDGASDPTADNQLGFYVAPNNSTLPSMLNRNALNRDVEWFAALRWERLLYGSWSQFSDMTSPMGSAPAAMFGLSIHGQKGEATKNPASFDQQSQSFRRDESRWASVAADISWEFGGSSAMLAGMYGYIDSGGFQDQYHIYGISAQYARYWAPKWEWFARYDWVEQYSQNFNTEDEIYNPENGQPIYLAQADSGVLCLGINHYLDGHHFKWTTDLNFTIDQTDQLFYSNIASILRDGEDGQQMVLRSQMQLSF
ncbi:MAG: porin [Planctomycetota bacterium]|nr:porin [Planctomycetota bacterium]